MPLFYFNIEDDAHSRDLDGIDLAGFGDVRSEALALLGETLKDLSRTAWTGRRLHVDVTDETGRIVYDLSLTVS